MEKILNFIGGEWKASYDGEEFPKRSPVNGKVISMVTSSKKVDVDEAIDYASKAFEKWWELGSLDRSKYLYKAIDLISSRRNELESILMLENGKIKPQAMEEVDGVIDQLQYYAEFARKITGDVVEGTNFYRKVFQYKVPYGIVAAITPWNFPAGMVARKLGPALITGNVVILKPSSDTPMSASWIVKKFQEAGIPTGVVQMLTGKGGEIGDYLVSHRKISLVTMTGSTSTGQRIKEKTSANMAKVILELGGKAPFIVWDDASIEDAIKAFLWAKFWNAGQSCIAAERLFVHEKIYDKFMKRLIEATNALKLGDPSNSDVGPLINENALSMVEKFVKIGEKDGFKVLTGGKRANLPGDLSNGYFFEPTILEGNDLNSELFQEEIFGPVVAATKVSSLDEAINASNNSKYGLASYLFTNNPRVIFSMAERLMFGELYVNMPGPEATQGYHTGFRMTGHAGEGSKYGVEEYVKIKNVYVDYSGEPISIPSMRIGP